MDGISAIPQQPQLGALARFLRSLESERPEFLPRQLDVMGLIRQLALPSASTVENLSYGNLPFTMPPAGTGAAIPQVKTGRKPEVADLVGMLGGVPGAGAVADVGTKLSNEAADVLVRAITRNPQATAQRVIQETSMPFMQAVAPRTPGLLETPVKSDIGFYSKLEEATLPLQNKGTGSQYLAQIEKTAGVKPEELQWTGLDEFLKSRQNVTKAEVQDYLAQNRVNVQEVRLGEPEAQIKFFNQNQIANAGFDNPGYVVYDRNGRFIDGPFDELIDAELRAERVSHQMGSPKFSSYTLPGGENYREILLTLPQKNPEFNPADLGRLTELSNKTRTPLETEEYRALAQRYDASLRGETTPEYRSSHFDQPNILAHMRVNDRVVDGKKTLFIEEIQSDWHQAGRKKGYADKNKPWELFDPTDAKIYGRFATEEEARAAKAALPENQSYFDIDKSEGVPDAPFKTTWHELALKRAIQEASEKGYDRIAFTTGKTQAERYDLSKQIGQITARPTPDGKISLEALTPDMREQVISKVVKADELDDIVGKEVADKIRTQIEYPKNFDDRGKSVKLSGLDLKVGGEGMKGFYDQILPKSLEKLGKKFDAKVTKSKMTAGTTQNKSFADALEKSEFKNEWFNASPERRSEIVDILTNRLNADQVEIWTMNINPKMRESALTKGQPLFAVTPAIPAAGLLGEEGE